MDVGAFTKSLKLSLKQGEITMKRFFQHTLLFSLVILLTVSFSAFSQQSEHEKHHPGAAATEGPTQPPAAPAQPGGMPQMGQGQGMMSGGMMGNMQEGGMTGMCPMCSMMMNMMGQGQGMMSGGMMGNMQGDGKGMMSGGMMGQGQGMQGQSKGMMPGGTMGQGQGMMSGGMMGNMQRGGQGMMSGDMMGQGQGMMPGGMMGQADAPLPMQLLKHAEQLQLTQEQQAKLRAIATGLQKEVIQQRAARELAQVDVEGLLAQKGASLDAISEKLTAVSKAEVASRIAEIRATREATAILTPEQQTRWQQPAAKPQDPHQHGNADNE